MNLNPLHKKDYQRGDEVVLIDPHEGRYWVRDSEGGDRLTEAYLPGNDGSPPRVEESIGKSYYFLAYDGMNEGYPNLKLTHDRDLATRTERERVTDEWFWIASEHVLPIEMTITDDDVADAIRSIVNGTS